MIDQPTPDAATVDSQANVLKDFLQSPMGKIVDYLAKIANVKGVAMFGS